jgi:outer membrane usher protein
MAGLPFASRPIGQGSFAVVEVGGLAGVPIRRSHQLVGTTDARGLAFVPGLLPWQKNLLQIEPDELPLDVEVQDFEQEVVPYAGSGRLVAFKVKRSRQALLVLRQPDGKPVPVGATVRLLPDGPESSAGLRGEVWLADLPAGRVRVRASWPKGGCTLELPASAAPGAPERIGPLTCGKEAP